MANKKKDTTYYFILSGTSGFFKFLKEIRNSKDTYLNTNPDYLKIVKRTRPVRKKIMELKNAVWKDGTLR